MRLHEILRSVGLEQQLLQKAMRNPGSKVGSLNKQFNSSHANFCHASPRWSKTREPSRCSDFHQRARPDLLALVAETNGNQVSLAVMRAAGCGLMTRGTVWHVQLVTVKLQYLWREKRSKSVSDTITILHSTLDLRWYNGKVSEILLFISLSSFEPRWRFVFDPFQDFQQIVHIIPLLQEFAPELWKKPKPHEARGMSPLSCTPHVVQNGKADRQHRC